MRLVVSRPHLGSVDLSYSCSCICGLGSHWLIWAANMQGHWDNSALLRPLSLILLQGPLGYRGLINLMTMAEVQNNKPQCTSTFQVIACVMCFNISLVKASYMVKFSNKYYRRSLHFQWEGVTKLNRKRCGYRKKWKMGAITAIYYTSQLWEKTEIFLWMNKELESI